jgi:hypothetical protein
MDHDDRAGQLAYLNWAVVSAQCGGYGNCDCIEGGLGAVDQTNKACLVIRVIAEEWYIRMNRSYFPFILYQNINKIFTWIQ